MKIYTGKNLDPVTGLIRHGSQNGKPYFITNAMYWRMRRYQKSWLKKNRLKNRRWHAEYRERNRKEIAARIKKWRSKNVDKTRAYMRKSYRKNYRKRYYSDPIFNMKVKMRRMIGRAMNGIGFGKKCATFSIIGCTKSQFIAHIEKQFKGRMSWALISKIHIDHIKPLRLAKTVEQVKALCHYKNLQPLWALDNMSKNGRYGK